MTGTLFVVATPIGNLADITLRALDTLKSVSLIAAEDTRVTRKLLERYDIHTHCISLREQNASRVIPGLISQLEAGEDIAVVSDAGTPSISDPGIQVVDAAHEAGLTVCPIPGPSALCTAVSAAALKGDGIRFVGFLPRRGNSRSRKLASISEDPAVCVIYESPHRVKDTLADLQAVCGDRMALLARELTKLHEDIRRNTLSGLMCALPEPLKGEVTIVLSGNPVTTAEQLSDAQLRDIVRAELERHRSAKDIATLLSVRLGVSRKDLYRIAVSLLNEID